MGRQARYVTRIWPQAVQSVGRMLDAIAAGEGLEVKAMCGRCRTDQVVDLDYLVAVRGRDYSLINRRGRCRMYGCGGSCVILYRYPHAPFMPLHEG